MVTTICVHGDQAARKGQGRAEQGSRSKRQQLRPVVLVRGKKGHRSYQVGVAARRTQGAGACMQVSRDADRWNVLSVNYFLFSVWKSKAYF